MQPATAIKLACTGLTATVACTVIGLAPYPAAAVMGASGVAAVGVNRSRTGDCWGSCSAHHVCDRDSGMCVAQACGGDCRIDEVCEHERCVLRRREQPGVAPDIDGSAVSPDEDGGVSP
ncbi:MAG TPA: hypothetical protein VK550_28825 [Polyangiaceae bacterium]|nr:hypothetical protein [Polyangiaceae bacterium]